MFQFIRTDDSTRNKADSSSHGAYIGAPSEATSDEVASGEVASGEVASGEVASGEVASGEVASGEVASGEVASGEVASGEVASGEVASGEVASGEVAPAVAVSVTNGPKLAVDVSRLDRAGATASFLCAIHCAVMPLVVTLLPLLGLSFLASEPVEWALLAASAILGSWSLCLGFRQHRSRRVFMVLGMALALLVAGRVFHEHYFGIWGPMLMVLGGFTMMSAHLINHRLCHACKECSADGCH